MPTDQTPREDDETLVLPATDTTADTTTDDTAVLPLDGATTGPDDTIVLPVDQHDTDDDDDATPYGTAVLPVETTASVDETRALPMTDDAATPLRTSAWASEPTSPIGTLYAPAARPDPVEEPAPVADDWAAPANAAPAPADPPRRRLRVGTVVWGLVIAAIGVGLLAWAAGFAIDLQLAMIVLLAVAGSALLVGSIVSGARNARR